MLPDPENYSGSLALRAHCARGSTAEARGAASEGVLGRAASRDALALVHQVSGSRRSARRVTGTSPEIEMAVAAPRSVTAATYLALLALCLSPALSAQTPAVVVRHANDGKLRLEDVPPIPPELAAVQRRYESVRSATLFDWSADGTSLLIGTRFAETEQLHRVDAPLGMRRQLSFLDEPVRAASRRPGSDQVLLVLDRGGDEFYQLQLFDPAAGSLALLTDGRSRNAEPVWSPDGHWLAFQSTRRDGVHLDVWVMDPDDPDDVRLVFEAPDGAAYAPAAFAPDGRSLLVTQYTALSDSRVHLVDLGRGESQVVAGGGLAPGHYLGIQPRFTRDGTRFYLATDEAGEFRQLAIQDVESGERELLSESIAWDVEEFAISPDGKRAAVTFNVDGVSELCLIETATNLLRPVPEVAAALGGGVLSELVFRPDGARLAFRYESPREPGDVYVIDVVESPKLTRWTQSELGGLDARRFVVPELVRYPTFDAVGGQNRAIAAWVSTPPGKGPFPVIVAIHGGPEGQARPRFDATQQLWLAELGAAVIAPNVRGSTGYGNTFAELDNAELREDAVRDLGALLDWIARRPELDASRVAVYGGSYGGYMALAAAMHHGERLVGAVDLVGISNFVSFLENTQEYRRDLRRAEYGDERDPDMRAFLQAISPANRAEEIHVPLFVAQGANDPRVPASEAEQIVRAVREQGREVWSLTASDEGHGFRRRANRAIFAQASLLFFREHLLPKRPDG